MKKHNRVISVLLYGVFAGYVILLMKILFFSRISPLELFDSQRVLTRSINLIPFYSILQYLSGGSAGVKAFAFGNVVGNIALFIPLGIYLPLTRRDKRVWPNLLIVLCTSVLAELLQGILGIGSVDIDDVILNCLGGLVGISVYRLLLVLLREENKVFTVVSVLGTVVGLPVIYYFLFVIKMRF
jgi:glycopeptide antibiotics resistance protein